MLDENKIAGFNLSCLPDAFNDVVSFNVINEFDANNSYIYIIELISPSSIAMFILKRLKITSLGQFSAEKLEQRVGYIESNSNKTPNHAKVICVFNSSDNEFKWILEEYISGLTLGDFIERNSCGFNNESKVTELIKLIQYYLSFNQKEVISDKVLAIASINEMIQDFDGVVNVFDLYPDGVFNEEILDFEKALISHSRLLKKKTNGTVIVSHGDFHPWNIMISGGDIYTVDRSRSLWNSPANDVACIIINLFVASLLSRDEEIGEAIFNFSKGVWLKCISESDLKCEILLAFSYFSCSRLPAICCPVFYPGISDLKRRALLKVGTEFLNRPLGFVEDDCSNFYHDFKSIFELNGGF
ncbi:aminoglycoside phosphotransferase [Pseudoalteromonas maricaloris]|uniref:aminoglycoside phosphotransferase n=1 Tax=Pseudoalteromonas maricaloris TaxID=184924 RepID=UPI00029A0EEE|nr:aminoglycoside phosphotransferase [Pseudoalteromonas flavipulchra]